MLLAPLAIAVLVLYFALVFIALYMTLNSVTGGAILTALSGIYHQPLG
jgi:hypothetical protein